MHTYMHGQIYSWINHLRLICCEFLRRRLACWHRLSFMNNRLTAIVLYFCGTRKLVRTFPGSEVRSLKIDKQTTSCGWMYAVLGVLHFNILLAFNVWGPAAANLFWFIVCSGCLCNVGTRNLLFNRTLLTSTSSVLLLLLLRLDLRGVLSDVTIVLAFVYNL